MSFLPPTLKEAIEDAHKALLHDSEYTITPFYRFNIYNIISPIESNKQGLIISHLAILTAEYVSFIWKKKFSNDIPLKAINVAKMLLENTISLNEAGKVADQIWTEMDKLSTTPIFDKDYRPLLAGQAAVQALIEVIGKNHFEDEPISRNYTDDDLDPWTSDTAKWAAAAISGKLGDSSSNLIKRREFWEWWLFEAINKAWELSNYEQLNSFQN